MGYDEITINEYENIVKAAKTLYKSDVGRCFIDSILKYATMHSFSTDPLEMARNEGIRYIALEIKGYLDAPLEIEVETL